MRNPSKAPGQPHNPALSQCRTCSTTSARIHARHMPACAADAIMRREANFSVDFSLPQTPRVLVWPHRAGFVARKRHSQGRPRQADPFCGFLSSTRATTLRFKSHSAPCARRIGMHLSETTPPHRVQVSIPEIKKQSSKGRYLTYAKYIVDVQCGRLRWNLSKRTADFVEFSAACVRAAGPHMQLRLPAVSRLGMSNSDRKTRARLYEELINKAKLESRLKPLLIKFLHFVVTADSTFKSRASKARHASSQGALQFQRTLLVQSALQSIFRLSEVIQLILSYDASGDLALRGHRGKVFGVSCSPDCNLVATSGADLCIRVWSRWSGALLATLNTAISTQTGSGRTSRLVFSVCFSSDGLGLAAGTGEGWVLVFSRSGASTGEKWALNTIIKPHSGPIFRIVRSPNGDIFASCSDDSTVALWEIGRHQKPIKLQSRFAEAVYDIAFSADGRVLAATGRDRMIQTWNVSRSRTSQSLTAQHGPQGDIVKAVPARIINVKNAVIRSLSYSPDGAFLAAGAYGSEDQATTQKRLILVRFLLCKHTCPPCCSKCHPLSVPWNRFTMQKAYV